VTFTQRVVAASAAAEAATGLALIAVPVVVGEALLGAALPSPAIMVARCFGVALLALALAVWPAGDGAGGRSAARAMLLYNALIALYLTWLATRWHTKGMLLWPAVALHAGLALLLAWSWRNVRD
jgi:hypothetical protein